MPESKDSGIFVCLACKLFRLLEREQCRLIGGEDNAKPSALLATAGCEGRLSKFEERSESKPILACIGGEVAKKCRCPNSECWYML